MILLNLHFIISLIGIATGSSYSTGCGVPAASIR